MLPQWVIWLIVAGVFFIGEIITTGFLIFWLGIGAILAMLISFVTDNVLIQIAVFVITSIILIVLTKPFVKKFVDKKSVATNSYSLIGRKAIVIENIDFAEAKGKVKINGEVWSAKATNDENIPKGTEVEITEITGVKLVVKPCNKNINV